MARNNNAVFQPNSRLVQGGVTDRFNKRLGWWERIVFEQTTEDIITYVQPGENGRPYRIAFRVYGRDNLGWLVLQYNNIVDINEELVVGAELLLPQPARVNLGILTRPVGGNPVE